MYCTVYIFQYPPHPASLLMPAALERLEAHVAAMGSQPHSALATPAVSPLTREHVGFFRPSSLDVPSSQPTPGRRDVDDPNAVTSASFVSVGPERAGPPAGTISAIVAQSRSVADGALDAYYDDIVRATVRRAWGRALSKYQQGWPRCIRAVESTGSTDALDHRVPEASNYPPQVSHGITRANSPQNRAPAVQAMPAAASAAASQQASALMREHPHRPASSKRGATTYSMNHAIRRGERHRQQLQSYQYQLSNAN